MPKYSKQFLGLGCLFLFTTTASQAHAPGPVTPVQDQGAPPATGRGQGPNDGRSPGLFGRIAAINNGSIELAKPDGATVKVKITDKTEYRKERQSAKLGDFKVGDVVFVRGEENADHSVTAQMIGGAQVGVMSGRESGGMAKDLVAGEVKSIDAPKLTVLQPNNVTQTLELNEETSLRRGRDSITMADIQPGDHVVVRGAVQNNAFVPKTVIVLSPEQWKQMEEMRKMIGPAGPAPAGTKSADAPKSNTPH